MDENTRPSHKLEQFCRRDLAQFLASTVRRRLSVILAREFDGPREMGRHFVEKRKVLGGIPNAACSEKERLLVAARSGLPRAEVMNDANLIRTGAVLAPDFGRHELAGSDRSVT